jgi:hypothetical protein
MRNVKWAMGNDFLPYGNNPHCPLIGRGKVSNKIYLRVNAQCEMGDGQ